MNRHTLVLGAHLFVAVLMISAGVFLGVNGDLVQFALLSAIGVMVGLLGRSASRLAKQL